VREQQVVVVDRDRYQRLPDGRGFRLDKMNRDERRKELVTGQYLYLFILISTRRPIASKRQRQVFEGPPPPLEMYSLHKEAMV